MSENPDADLAAIVLAGGTGERLGGVSKADLELSGRRLLDRVLDALSGAGQRVVVGDVEAPAGVRVLVEDPPRSGPAAGIVAGLAALGPADHVLVLACDLADPGPGIAALMLHLPLSSPVDGLCVGDSDRRPQWLFGVYRRAALDAAASGFGAAAHRSVRALMAPLRLAVLPDEANVSGDDIDTWSAHAQWSARLAGRAPDRLDAADSQIPEAQIPETQMSETQIPETQIPEAQITDEGAR